MAFARSIALLAFAAGIALAQPAAPALSESKNAPRPPAATERSPEDAAKLRADGAFDFRAHDPSTLVRCGDEFWFFYTGRGVPSYHSKDLKTWTAGPPIFSASPDWVATTVPENRGTMFWAPDVIHLGDRYLVYYSVSSFGKNTSAIALVSNPTLDPAAANFKWTDEGIVVRSAPPDKFNTIDPAITLDADGRLWMAFGSYWSGIKLMELDPKTGQRIAADSPLYALAHAPQIEASYIYRHDGKYYLFVNHGFCCRGVNSTYNIRVGRAEKITGPYLDREGRDLLHDGGTLVLETDGPFIGPGHAGIIAVDGKEWFSCHFYDATQRGRPGYAIRPLTWDAEGWPVVGRMEK